MRSRRLYYARGEIDVRPLLPRIDAPTLVLHGRDDDVVDLEEGRMLAGMIRGASFVPLESRNRILLEDEPWPRFLHEVRDFLAQGS